MLSTIPMQPKPCSLDSLSLEDLSPFVRRLVEDLGSEDALRFIQTFGGQQLRVPETVGDGHWLVERLGLALAQKLVEYYSFEVFQVPIGRGIQVVLARQKICQDLQSGKYTYNEIAARNEVTVRTVYACASYLRSLVGQARVLAAESTYRQLPLFELW